MCSRNYFQAREGETLKESAAADAILEEESKDSFFTFPQHQTSSGQHISQIAESSSRWPVLREETPAGNECVETIASPNRPPRLPETIEFRTSPQNKKAGGRGRKRCLKKASAQRQQYEKYRMGGDKARIKSPAQEKAKDLLLESLFMMMYIRRSTTTIPITISMLRTTNHPMLLTMTSYPFRVLYSNLAYQNTTGGDDMVGRTLFECFESNEEIMKPSLSLYPAFLKLLLDGGRPCSIHLREHQAGRITTMKDCTIKAENVYAMGEQVEKLHYYVIHFDGVI
ncbi:unnamed protein product [Cylindrotheca closterium]|uniref:Uncharacterized protein n=1 Tax=Cylindrotheca closterium TaxID=2856 RepID=A0AAD2G6F9_9STRA|nr:unnamed protein product [Cylindrotheca closterium]